MEHTEPCPAGKDTIVQSDYFVALDKIGLEYIL